MKVVSAVFRGFPIVIAACSLILAYAFSRIDSIVHQVLYGYGLQFSYDWATTYWNFAWVTVAMGWLIFGMAVVFQVYLLSRKASSVRGGMSHPVSKEEERWSTFRLGDGSTIKVKLVVKGAKRLNKYAPDGTPVYTVDTENIVRVVDVPEALKSSPAA